MAVRDSGPRGCATPQSGGRLRIIGPSAETQSLIVQMLRSRDHQCRATSIMTHDIVRQDAVFGGWPLSAMTTSMVYGKLAGTPARPYRQQPSVCAAFTGAS